MTSINLILVNQPMILYWRYVPLTNIELLVEDASVHSITNQFASFRKSSLQNSCFSEMNWILMQCHAGI